MTRFALRNHYAYADHVIAMWYDSEEDSIFLMFHMGRSDNEKDRWTAFRILQCRTLAPGLTPFRMPVKATYRGVARGGNGMADHQTLFMPRLRGILTLLTKLYSVPLTVMSDRFKCRQGSKTNKSNCEFWKKLTFDWFVQDLFGHTPQYYSEGSPSHCKDCC
jgi:hypothetical protein